MQIVHNGDDLGRILTQAAAGSQIFIEAGVYRVKAMISAPGVTVTGEGPDKTVLIWDDYAKKLDGQGREYVTFRTWTLAVCADDVTMRDLAVVNDALRPEEKGQEVALTVYGDNFLMENCRLTSTQDTLFLGPLPDDLIDRYEGFLPDLLRSHKACRQVFRRCLIEGTVDFIFGCGDALFEDCEIRSLVDARGRGFVAAPAHEKRQERGFLFKNCRMTRQEGLPDGCVYLARPWRDYGISAFVDCVYDGHIDPLGFDKWNDTHRDETARFYEAPLRPGRVPWARKIGS